MKIQITQKDIDNATASLDAVEMCPVYQALVRLGFLDVSVGFCYAEFRSPNDKHSKRYTMDTDTKSFIEVSIHNPRSLKPQKATFTEWEK